MPYPNGLFTWADVSLPDPAAGSQFYSALFGWDAEDQQDPEGNYVYTMFSRDGKTVAGLGPMPQEMQAAGAPPTWNSYVTVHDLDATVAAAEANGGTVMGTMDVFTSGRMAIVADPTGAMLMLWQPQDHVGAQAFTGHGSMTWNELATRDRAKAQEFYRAVLGWTYEDSPGPFDYQLIVVDEKEEEGQPYFPDKLNGGMLTMDETWPAEMPAHWMVYFTVDNTDDLIAKLEELGGEVAVPAFDTDQGKIAVVRDPQGGTFSVIAPSQAVPAEQA